MANLLRTGPFVGKVLKDFMTRSGLEPTLFGAKNLRLLNARPGSVTLELDILKQHTNRMNILHGGTIASMVDLGGSLAVASHGLFATGVSTDLNVTYIATGGKAGDKIKVMAECDKMGSTLAYTRVSFYKDDVLVARGSHTKLISRARLNEATAYKLPLESGDKGDMGGGGTLGP